LYSVNSNLPVTPFIYKVVYDSKAHLNNTTVSGTPTGAADIAWNGTKNSVHETTVSKNSFSMTGLGPPVGEYAVSPTTSQTAISATPRTISTTSTTSSSTVKALQTVSNKSFSMTGLGPAVNPATSQTATSPQYTNGHSTTPSSPRITSTANQKASQKAHTLDSTTSSQISSSETASRKAKTLHSTAASAVRLALADFLSDHESWFDDRFTYNLALLISVLFLFGLFKCKHLFRHAFKRLSSCFMKMCY
jgi:hypothetical protein